MAKQVNVPATKSGTAISADKAKQKTENLPMLPNDKTIAAWNKEGPAILEAYFAGDKLEVEGLKLVAQGETRKFEASQRMAHDMVKIFKAEPLARDMAERAFIGGKALMPKAIEYFKCCFGFAKVLKDSEGNKTTEDTDAWKKRFFAPKSSDADTNKKFEEKRNNFSTFMRMSMQRARALDDLKEIDEITFDDASKAIQITGKGVEKTFGASTVILNKRDGKDEPAAKGKMVASLEALRKQAVDKRKPSTGAGGKGKEEGNAADPHVKTPEVTAVDNQKACQQAMNSAIFYINKLNRKADPDTRKLMRSLSEALKPFLDTVIPKGSEEHNKITLAHQLEASVKAEAEKAEKAEKANVAGTQAGSKPANTAAAKKRQVFKSGKAR